jgi:hypothetical protein
MAPSIGPVERPGPAPAPLCDRCHMARGFKFVLHFWVCAACRLALLNLLESEKGWGDGDRWL